MTGGAWLGPCDDVWLGPCVGWPGDGWLAPRAAAEPTVRVDLIDGDGPVPGCLCEDYDSFDGVDEHFRQAAAVIAPAAADGGRS